uniref:Uncharacterized protein n=1 Tax=Strongyloides venezuelensis TaxID=75913 RepID=A0A0K0FKY6_STRVS
MIEYEFMEEKREAARKRMPRCVVQRTPFHLLCYMGEKDYVDENDIHVGEIDRSWLTSTIQCVDESKVATIFRYPSKYAINLKNLNIKIAFLSILKYITYTTSELLESDKKEELEKYGKELARRIVKYLVEKILSDNRLLDEEAKGCFSSDKIPELIRYIYGSLIDWNNY